MLNHSLVPVGSTGYDIDNSLRFNDDDSAYLSRTPSTAGNRKTWTWSGWVKGDVVNTGTNQYLLSVPNGTDGIAFRHSGNTNAPSTLYMWLGGTGTSIISTDMVFRDSSAWYHIAITVDTTQATASNRMKIYVNGVLQSLGYFTTYISQNYDTAVNNTETHRLGASTSGTQTLNGYLAEVNFIDGQALDPSNFGETGDYGEWKPIKYTGTYGTNGFYLNFKGDDSIIAATGGTITTYGDYKIHTFTSNGTLNITSAAGIGVIDVLTIAGGGAGNTAFGAGGGAGGLILNRNYSVSAGDAFSMTVGTGGSGSSKTNGNNSIFAIYGGSAIDTAIGGGLGGGEAPSVNGSSGGSGGGGGYASGSGGAGTAGQGNAGGSGTGTYTMGGGGGYGAVGGSGNGTVSGNGGTGYDASTLFGTSIPNSGLVAGGGGGGAGNGKTRGTGSHGGGNGQDDSSSATSPVANTGGGGGGRGTSTTATGADGVVIVRYKFQ